LLSIGCRLDREPLLFQGPLDHPPDAKIVIDDENARPACFPRSLGGQTSLP
jgi:hypothetical protein